MTDIGKKHQKAREQFFTNLAILLQEQGMEWGQKLISSTEQRCEFLPNYHHILFPEGIMQIMEGFESWQDEQMLGILEKEEKKIKVREKIQRALEVRLLETLPKSVILKQNALFLLPNNLLLGTNCYSKTCDIIWRYAGDKSDDFNYYTKRGLLFTVYALVRLFYLADNSEGYIKTKEFIATSLDNIINIASIKNKLKFPHMEDIPIFRLFS